MYLIINLLGVLVFLASASCSRKSARISIGVVSVLFWLSTYSLLGS